MCAGCALIAVLGGEEGSKPEIKEAQKEVWRRILYTLNKNEGKEK